MPVFISSKGRGLYPLNFKLKWWPEIFLRYTEGCYNCKVYGSAPPVMYTCILYL